MDINNSTNIISQIAQLTEDDIDNVDIVLSLVERQKHSDAYYKSLEISLHPDVKEWMILQLVGTLNKLRVNDDEGNSVFFVADYNHEINKLDYIAKFDCGENSSLKEKKDKLIRSIVNSDEQYNEKNTNFQIVAVTIGEKRAYFCYYRGIKKNTSRKRMVYKNSNLYSFKDDVIIEVGGNIDFFIIDDYIFILNVTKFEYTFDYRDHINTLRDERLNAIVCMPFFNGENSNNHIFAEKCKNFVYSRSLAQITHTTLSVLQDNFIDRCNELAQIKRNVPTNEDEKEEYITKLGTIWDLFKYIDLDNYKIKFDDGDNPTLLLNFFTDKIVKSFLTEDIKVALGYE